VLEGQACTVAGRRCGAAAQRALASGQASQQTAAQGVKAASGAQGPSCRGQAGWRRQASNSHALQGGTGRDSGLWHLRERCRRRLNLPSQRAGADSDAFVYGRVQQCGGPRAASILLPQRAARRAARWRPVVWRMAERSKISTPGTGTQTVQITCNNLFSGTNAELVLKTPCSYSP